jgi:hypothetical protein
VTAAVKWNNNNTTVYVTYILKNSVIGGRENIFSGNPQTSTFVVVSTADDVFCNAGDVLQLGCQQNAGGPVGTSADNPNMDTGFSAALVSI